MTKLFGLLLTAVLASSCASTSTTAPVVDATPSDPQAIPAAAKVLVYLASLTSREIPGVIAGQNCGHGGQIADPSNANSYANLFTELESQTKQAPGLVGIDYEHDQIFTPEQLSKANEVLVEHWNRGGLVTINWSPQNPWLNDESDLAANPGVWTNTRSQGHNMDKVNLDDLTNSQSAIYPVWRRKLDRVAAALGELQDAGVVVLWRPLQEMNGWWFWWGTRKAHADGSSYRALYRDMFQYFTQTKHLHNLLWVYSPCSVGAVDPGVEGPLWAYPGNDVVDVVAGTSYDDSLRIPNYAAYVSTGKPVAMAEYGANSGGQKARSGTFDNRRYAEVLSTFYPGVAYWVSWHDWDNGDGTWTHQSLLRNASGKEALNDPRVLTLNAVRSARIVTKTEGALP